VRSTRAIAAVETLAPRGTVDAALTVMDRSLILIPIFVLLFRCEFGSDLDRGDLP
jgi:hypothetical protein